MRQLTIDGNEVEYEALRRKARTFLNPRQMFLLRWMAEHGGQIRSVEAGKIVHQDRGSCGYGNRDTNAGEPRAHRIACCNYAATDGNEAMKRLMERGIVRRLTDRGPWARVNPDA